MDSRSVTPLLSIAVPFAAAAVFLVPLIESEFPSAFVPPGDILLLAAGLACAAGHPPLPWMLSGLAVLVVIRRRERALEKAAAIQAVAVGRGADGCRGAVTAMRADPRGRHERDENAPAQIPAEHLRDQVFAACGYAFAVGALAAGVLAPRLRTRPASRRAPGRAATRAGQRAGHPPLRPEAMPDCDRPRRAGAPRGAPGREAVRGTESPART
ncbi:hypothetical protein KGA66_22920 [Actinocrinis puniceicyclus]|uniref:Uncharacterized protein n=1 Tax=Actinocrinis puniceicyclus TaxID=977794 RepID=A0A8J8BF82_9ACTN|nr:hypothetical protein [Actinocrinis puniceicyclus]MBS2965916.1 hypothetical protein [Actinocrinis puniceicyclus]